MMHHSSRRRATPHALRDPSRARHRCMYGEARRVTMVGRTALAVVVKPVEGLCARRTAARRVGSVQRKHQALELPVGIALDRLAFARVRGVEVRAPRAEADAEEAAHVARARGIHGGDGEGLAGPRPADKRAVVELRDLVCIGRYEVMVESGMAVLDGLGWSLISARDPRDHGHDGRGLPPPPFWSNSSS